jgi:uncharacterized protein YrrD
MTLADLRRKPVVSMSDGLKIGEVEDLIVDVSRWVVSEFRLAAKGIHGLLPVSHVKGIGPDAMTVESADAVDWTGKPTGRLLTQVKELTVVDGSGTILGHLTDLKFGNDGTIESMEVHRGGVLGIGVHITVVKPSEVRGVSDRLITVEISPA